MSQVTSANQPEHLSPTGEATAPILEFWRIIRPHKKLMAKVTVGSMLLAMVISLFVLDKTFESTAALVPPLESEGLGLSGILSAAGGLGGAAQNMGLSLPGAPATPTDLFMAMLKSRVIADAVIKKFNLQAVYDIDTMVKTRKALTAATSITLSREKVLKVTVEDTDPQRAADMANFYLEELDRFNQMLNVDKAGNKRQFVESQMEKTRTKMVEIEEAIKEFQTKHKTVAMEEQSKAMVGAVAAVQSQLMSQIVQLQVMQTYLSPEHPEILRIRSSVDELRKQLTALEVGDGEKRTKIGKIDRHAMAGAQSQPAIVDVPTLALEYGRMVRELKVQEALYTLMTTELEQTRYSEARNTPTVQVLDPAVPADFKSSPITSLNMVVGGILGFLISLGLSYRKERKRMIQDSLHLVTDQAA
jgi:capsule polysaccharide export protein KpsE/RkpR